MVIVMNTPLTMLWSLRLAHYFGLIGPSLSKSVWVGTSKKKITRAITTVVDPGQVPKEFGGTADGFVWPTATTSSPT